MESKRKKWHYRDQLAEMVLMNQNGATKIDTAAIFCFVGGGGVFEGFFVGLGFFLQLQPGGL